MTVLGSLYNGFTTDDGTFSTRQFVEAALLFDELQFSNPSLLPQLIRATGVDGVKLLIDSNLLKIVGGGPNAQGKFDYISPGFFKNRTEIYRPLNFGFETIFVDPDHSDNLSVEDRITRDLSGAKKIAKVSDQDLGKLHDSIVSTMNILDGKSLDTHDVLRTDIANHQNFLVGVIVEHLAAQSIPVHALNVEIAVDEVSDNIYRVSTNLGKLLSIDDRQLHELVKEPFFEITATNLHLRRMHELNAASGLTGRASQITAKRLNFLSRVHVDSDNRPELTKIIDLTAVPTFDPGAKFDAEELLELRQSESAAVFRDFIRSGGGMNEEEITDALESWRRKAGEKIRTPVGKPLRWLASTGVGTVLDPLSGIAVSGIDYFLDKLLPDMGPIGFIDSEYRVFVEKQKKLK